MSLALEFGLSSIGAGSPHVARLVMSPPNGLELSRSAAQASFLYSRTSRQARNLCIFARQPSRLQRVVGRTQSRRHCAIRAEFRPRRRIGPRELSGTAEGAGT